MIALLAFGYLPYLSLSTYHAQENSVLTSLVKLQKLLYYILLLKSVRLIRFIVRFISGFYLMITISIGWLCRKRVRKGRTDSPQLMMPKNVDLERNIVYDGIPLSEIKQIKKKKGDEDSHDTP
jgi:hypothetical protein